MNKLFFIMAIHLATVLPAAKTNAQDALIARSNRQNIVLPISSLRSYSISLPSDPDRVSDQIIKKFTKQYGSITDATWIKDNYGFEVRFTSNGILNRVFLTKHGNYHSSVRYYTEKSLPASMRHLIKSAYYDFDITSVQEVQYGPAMVYLVTIADATKWKTLRIDDDQMIVWEEHLKN